MAVCWCVNQDCERIFAGEELKYIDIWGDDAVLPCGHKPKILVLCASALRDAEEAENKLKKMQPRLGRICKTFCNNCQYDCPCECDPFNENCKRFK